MAVFVCIINLRWQTPLWVQAQTRNRETPSLMVKLRPRIPSFRRVQDLFSNLICFSIFPPVPKQGQRSFLRLNGQGCLWERRCWPRCGETRAQVWRSSHPQQTSSSTWKALASMRTPILPFSPESIKKNIKSEPKRWLSASEQGLFSQSTRVKFPAPATGQLTSIFNSSPRRNITLFWPLKAPGTQVVVSHICR